MQNVMVTGGAGMTGSALVDRLIEQGDRVTVVDDLSRGSHKYLNPKAKFIHHDVTNGVPYGISVDAVYHLAARVGGVKYTQVNQWENAVNAAIDWKVIEFCTNNRLPLLYVSSACVYSENLQYPTIMDASDALPVPIREADINSEYQPDSLYGWAKLFGEFTLQSAIDERALPAKVVRLFNVYGPRVSPDASAHVIPALIYRSLTMNGSGLTVWGTGQQRRSFVHVNDVVDGILLVMEKGKVGEAYNIGTPETVTILELATTILSAVRSEGAEITVDPTQPQGVFGRCANIDKIQTLGWSPTVGLKSGIFDTVAWCRRWWNL